MSTDAQRYANQQNAQHSTGPLTPEGKAASSRNSFRHGLSSAAIIALPGENIQDYIDLANSLRVEHKPVTVTEDALVTKMAQGLWLGKRAVNLQQRTVLSPQFDQQLFNLYTRYQNTNDRLFSKSLAELQKLRDRARQQEIGFVSQKRAQEQHIARIRNLNASSQAAESVAHSRNLRVAPLKTVAATPSAAAEVENHAKHELA